MSNELLVRDSTLREGEQTPGVSFPPHVRAAMAEILDEVGVQLIEAGHPAVSPRILGPPRLIHGTMEKPMPEATRLTIDSAVEAVAIGSSMLMLRSARARCWRRRWVLPSS